MTLSAGFSLVRASTPPGMSFVSLAAQWRSARGRTTTCGKPTPNRQGDCYALGLCWSSYHCSTSAFPAFPWQKKAQQPGHRLLAFILVPARPFVCGKSVFSMPGGQTTPKRSTSKRRAYSIQPRIAGA
jgi:hypothetical protein